MKTQRNRFFLKRFLFMFPGILFSLLAVVGVLATNRNPVADFDGDGKTDISVFRPSNGFWYWISSIDKSFNSYQFGLNGDKPVPGDYDGDGKTDFAVLRPTSGIWYIQQSMKGFRAEPFGLSTDIPIPNVFVRRYF